MSHNKQIRTANFAKILEDTFKGSNKDAAEALGVVSNVISHWKTGRNGITDPKARLIEEKLSLPVGFMDQDASKSLPAVITKPIKTGELHVTAQGFELKMDLMGSSDAENEITRLALRIVEVRCR